MSADEMFEKLRYMKEKNDHFIEYRRQKENLDITVKCKYYAGYNGKTCDNCIKQYFENKANGGNER